MRSIVVNILAGIISLAGLMVMAGWILDIPILASWIPGEITMKFATALSFFLSGIVLYCIGRLPRPGEVWSDLVLTMVSFSLALLMGTFLLYIIAGIHIGIEDIFVKDTTPTVHDSIPGRPSIPAAIAFTLVAAAGFFWTGEIKKYGVIVRMCGVIVAAIGGVAIVGYLAGIPVLYYAVTGVSNPIAVSSAALFALLGVGLIFASGEERERERESTPFNR